jgi:hypothetical protein
MVFGGAADGPRTPVVIGFLLICPGLSLTRLLDIRELATAATLTLALSITVDTGLAGLMLYAGVWSPRIEFAVLVAIVAVATALDALLRPHKAPVGEVPAP